jgi:hypothetical protein
MWMLMRDPNEARAWLAAVAVQAEDMRGVRPRDWGGELVEEMLAARRERVFPHLKAFFRELDKGNTQAGLEHLEAALAYSDRAGRLVRQSLFLSAAQVSGFERGKCEAARQWWQFALKLGKPQSDAAAKATIAICEGRFEDALRDIAESRVYLAKLKQRSGSMLFINERLDEYERRCRAGREFASPVGK